MVKPLTPAQSVPQAPAWGAMTLLVGGVIVHDRPAARVLLLRRGPGAKFGQGLWDLPVGKSQDGEPVLSTAARELREETGLSVKPEDLRLVHVIHGARGVEAPHGFLTVIFAAHRWSGTPTNAEPHKHDRVAWTPVEAIPEEFVPTTHAALTGYLSGDSEITLDGWHDQQTLPISH